MWQRQALYTLVKTRGLSPPLRIRICLAHQEGKFNDAQASRQGLRGWERALYTQPALGPWHSAATPCPLLPRRTVGTSHRSSGPPRPGLAQVAAANLMEQQVFSRVVWPRDLPPPTWRHRELGQSPATQAACSDLGGWASYWWQKENCPPATSSFRCRSGANKHYHIF